VNMQFSTTAARSRDMLRRNTAADQPRRSSMGLVNETLRTSFFYKEEELLLSQHPSERPRTERCLGGGRVTRGRVTV
jgi:hypothetical protein